MKRWKRIFSRFLPMLLISLILGGSLWSWNARRFGGSPVPMPFGVGLSVVLSGSMEPALSVGDLLVIRETDDYSIGEIVVYRSGSIAIVHRLIELDSETAVTKGDANNVADERIDRADILGRVAAVIPVIGYLILALKTPAGILIALALAIWLIECSHRREKRQAEEEQDKILKEILELRRQIGEKNKTNTHS